MSEVKRYDCKYNQDGEPDLPCFPNGGMVRYEDYASLEARAKRLEAFAFALGAIWAGDELEAAKLGLTALLFGSLGGLMLLVEVES